MRETFELDNLVKICLMISLGLLRRAAAVLAGTFEVSSSWLSRRSSTSVESPDVHMRPRDRCCGPEHVPSLFSTLYHSFLHPTVIVDNATFLLNAFFVVEIQRRDLLTDVIVTKIILKNSILRIEVSST